MLCLHRKMCADLLLAFCVPPVTESDVQRLLLTHFDSSLPFVKVINYTYIQLLSCLPSHYLIISPVIPNLIMVLIFIMAITEDF